MSQSSLSATFERYWWASPDLRCLLLRWSFYLLTNCLRLLVRTCPCWACARTPTWSWYGTLGSSWRCSWAYWRLFASWAVHVPLSVGNWPRLWSSPVFSYASWFQEVMDRRSPGPCCSCPAGLWALFRVAVMRSCLSWYSQSCFG